MAKAKTSATRAKSTRKFKSKPFNIETAISTTPKNPHLLTPHHPEITLRDPVIAGQALLECLMDGDHEAFKEILAAHLRVLNKDAVSARTGVARSTLFRMLEPKSNPTLKNVAKVCRVLKAS